ncbi:hypothetical protein [Streptosporangium saharense]|uniref:Uncharacterized protein n=1 Tax=Streptosporangium saharense TaxID=1706840 RepID=A0A7W7QQM2_9ACTN|nr:hypothetical protein [Streptosporangium saharense]MBB4917995.1 hypothetical protein [Streptosporangium saharense]
MNFCLSDLVPPLRWSDAATIPLLRDQPELPGAWWRSLPVSRVLAVLGPERLAGILAGITLDHWPAAAVGDVLPALYVLDPEDADEPCTAIALDRAGSWAGLLALTGHELREQPFIQPLPVLNALFGAVLTRLANPDVTPVRTSGSTAKDAPATENAPEEPAQAEEAPEAEAGAVPEDEPEAPETAPEAPETPEAASESPEAEEAAEEPAKAVEPVAAVQAAAPPAPPEPEPIPLPRRKPSPPVRAPEPPPQEKQEGSLPERGLFEPMTAIKPEPEPEAEPEPEPENEPEKAEETPEPVAEEQPPPRQDDLYTLLDGAFANLDDRSWAVAQNRVFTDAPATVEALSKLFAVQPEVIDEAETALRHRLGEWLASEEAAPYRDHLVEVGKALGKAAPKARLATVVPWHARELRSLDVPAWQFVLATLPDHRLAEDWIVEGDITELRHRTRDVISGAKPPLTMSKALDLVASLGIHHDMAKEWLAGVPQLRILGAGQRPPQQAPPSAPEDEERKEGPFRPLKDVSLTWRCFRQPDGRWWLRIDVTAEHLRGGECPLPSGFAAYLGLSPGAARRVQSAVGELGLSWQERPVLESLRTLLEDAGAKAGAHLFVTLSDEGVLRARHLPAAGGDTEPVARALRLVGYTAPGGTAEQAARVIATRVGMTGQVGLPDLLARLRERGDRDLLSLLA